MIKFEIANRSDIVHIARIRRKCWEETYRGIYSDSLIDDFDYGFHEKKIKDNILDENVNLFTIQFDNEIVGYFLFGNPRYMKFDNYQLQLYSVNILKKYHRKGIGTRVFKFISSYCSDNQLSGFCFTCNSHNVNAKTFYQQLGCEIIEEVTGHNRLEEDQSFYYYSIK